MKINYSRSIRFLLFIILCMSISCKNDKKIVFSNHDVAIKWSEMAIFITQFTPANTPTYASRCFGYIGLTQYESIVEGFAGYNSIAGALNGLGELPKPKEDETYSWALSLNAGQAYILKKIYNQTSDENKLKIDSLEQLIYESFEEEVKDKKMIQQSVDYGREIAEIIFEWSKTDGGHRGYLNNFDKNFKHDQSPGSWVPPLYSQSISHFPLHPYWGENRVFLKINAELPNPEMIPYDTDKDSPYYLEFLEVYHKEKVLTKKEKEAAIWWGDDPDVSFTPPGHSYYISTMALKGKNASMIVCAETYAKVGVAVADAFICCWKWKYHFFSERPNTFIPQFIDEEWHSFWPDPPFPCFPSGHAIQASTAATVLENIHGKTFKFTDSSNVGRLRDEFRDTDFVVRSFDSFWAAAQETADSRFYGGIHTAQDNIVGLEEGRKIAQNVNNLNWKTK